MKRAWTRLWASASAVLISACSAGGWSLHIGAQHATRAIRNNELILAGLRPGKATTRKAAELNKDLGRPRSDGDAISWHNPGTCETLVLYKDASGVIETIRLFSETHNREKTCGFVKPGMGWRTGRGLALGTPCAEVSRLYGEPDSRSPSTAGGQQLELWYYAFDWAGPGVPQILAVECTAGKDGEPGRVVEITLAASSL